VGDDHRRAGGGGCAGDGGARRSAAAGTPTKLENELPGTVSSVAWCYMKRRKQQIYPRA
jgi:hypothetical protein